MIYGYIRVSTDKQTVKVARLVPTLREAPHKAKLCQSVFIHKRHEKHEIFFMLTFRAIRDFCG